MPRKFSKRSISPQLFFEDLLGAWKVQALVAALELDVFTHIASGKRTIKEIAEATGASERGMTALLNSLVAVGYLKKGGGRYGLQPIAATFLVRGKDQYMGGRARIVRNHWNTWGQLTEAIKTGRPIMAVDVVERGKEFFPQLVAELFPANIAASQAVARRLPEKTKRGIRRILDVGAGSGAWSLAFAQAIPEARVTAQDLPEVISITRKFAEKLGAGSRYDYLEGDFKTLDFGREKYDVVILGHILHSEGEARGRELVRKCYAALRPGGLLLIAEPIPNDTRSGPPFAALFALNMVLLTEEGNVFTLREYRAWLKGAGFRKVVTTIAAPSPSPLILATK
jgi:2-polyprenyl-3-methyl-5-hydroxy-6-metoxy-1,4-benzoquinol methylase